MQKGVAQIMDKMLFHSTNENKIIRKQQKHNNNDKVSTCEETVQIQIQGNPSD